MKTPKIIKSEKGAAVVEFAIVLPLLVLILCGMIEFGLLFYNKQVITNASREGARTGITRTDSNNDENVDKDDIKLVVKNYCEGRLITFGGTGFSDGNVLPEGANGLFQADLTVKVTYDYNFLTPSILGFDSTMTIGAQTVMKMEPE